MSALVFNPCWSPIFGCLVSFRTIITIRLNNQPLPIRPVFAVVCLYYLIKFIIASPSKRILSNKLRLVYCAPPRINILLEHLATSVLRQLLAYCSCNVCLCRSSTLAVYVISRRRVCAHVACIGSNQWSSMLVLVQQTACQPRQYVYVR